jgi:uracil-DNA glycosylase family 4
MADAAPEPPGDCPLCPRLAEFRQRNRDVHPDFHNAPVPAFGPLDAGLLIVGLAPGLKGANRTGRPFTGDYAGDLLYPTLIDAGLAEGTYGRSPDDGLRLRNARITNAVRCVPPQNKPDTAEIATCRRFLSAEIAAMEKLSVILALGSVAHKSVLAAIGYRQSARDFAHSAVHHLETVTLIDSYHCSRYNVNTWRLTPAMFRDVVDRARRRLDAG